MASETVDVKKKGGLAFTNPPLKLFQNSMLASQALLAL